jgi:biopolymer transport protein ExbD
MLLPEVALMRVRTRPLAGVKLDMTPLIDVVFQLLAFFCLTFRIATLEGDLAMQPPARTGGGPATFAPTIGADSKRSK